MNKYRTCNTRSIVATLVALGFTGVADAGRPPAKKSQQPTPIQSQFSPAQWATPAVQGQGQPTTPRPVSSSGQVRGTTGVPATPTAARPNPPPARVQPTPTVPQTPNRYGSSVVTFDNRSGEPATVRLVGPTRGEVHVPNGGRNSIRRVAAGHYTIYVKYGTPGNDRHSRGDSFDVRGSGRSYSHVVITLHPVQDGNYAMHDSNAEEFAAAGR